MRKANSHRDLARLAAAHCLRQGWCQVVSWELAYNTGIADVVGLSTTNNSSSRITVIEVKRTRADLIHDLRSKKMLRYEKGSTHCVLAATPEALNLNKLSTQQAIDELKKLGLPKTWGIWVVPTYGRKRPYSIKNSKRIGKFSAKHRDALIQKIAISFCRRALNRHSPIKA